MERNWLIRTTQKQILGPVAKAKVLEFLQKGALGLNDEVTSGNGYWFSLKEKDLVEKYLLGDVPQSYNPISESRSVLSKRENPDKTSSLNATPLNRVELAASSGIVLPPKNDLDYPEVELDDITRVNSSLSELMLQVAESAPKSAPAAPPPTVKPIGDLGEMKLPTSDDLEFPDVTLIKAAVNGPTKIEIKETSGLNVPSQKTVHSSGKIEVQKNADQLIYPKDEDLAFPDMDAIVASIEEERDFVVPLKKSSEEAPVVETKKATTKEFHNEFEPDSGLSLNSGSFHNEDFEEKPAAALKLQKSKTPEEKKLLHERKTKSSSHHHSHDNDMQRESKRPALAENLKKRNDNYLMYMLIILVLIIVSLFFYYYKTILNKPLPV